MSAPVQPALRLSHAGAMVVLQAALARAEAMGVAQNIVVVDDGGNLMAFLRMDGAKLMSMRTARAKAISAASHRQPSGRLDPALAPQFAAATGGALTNLEGGLPLMVAGQCLGGIGVGSGKGHEDVEVAQAGVDALVAAYVSHAGTG